jgi:hypothetical protein
MEAQPDGSTAGRKHSRVKARPQPARPRRTPGPQDAGPQDARPAGRPARRTQPGEGTPEKARPEGGTTGWEHCPAETRPTGNTTLRTHKPGGRPTNRGAQSDKSPTRRKRGQPAPGQGAQVSGGLTERQSSQWKRGPPLPDPTRPAARRTAQPAAHPGWSAAPAPPAAPAEAGAQLRAAERAVGARAVVVMGGALMAADTQRFRRRHRFTHGADDLPSRLPAGRFVTVSTYPSTAAGGAAAPI